MDRFKSNYNNLKRNPNFYWKPEFKITKHKVNCIVINRKQAIRMPKKGSKVQVQNYHKQMQVPFVIYADFAITEKDQGSQPNSTKCYTDKYQKHTGCRYGYKVVCCYDDKYTNPVNIYRGEASIKKFMQEMLKEVELSKAERFKI